jgi:hypothetical protein
MAGDDQTARAMRPAAIIRMDDRDRCAAREPAARCGIGDGGRCASHLPAGGQRGR